MAVIRNSVVRNHLLHQSNEKVKNMTYIIFTLMVFE